MPMQETGKRVLSSRRSGNFLDRYGSAGSEDKLRRILDAVRAAVAGKRSYIAGNILNLLIYLRSDLRGYDFSRLVVQQAYLRGAELPEVNFPLADLSTSVFTGTFTSILCVAVSPNGGLLAVGTTTGEALLRQADTLTPLHACLGHADGYAPSLSARIASCWQAAARIRRSVSGIPVQANASTSYMGMAAL